MADKLFPLPVDPPSLELMQLCEAREQLHRQLFAALDLGEAVREQGEPPQAAPRADGDQPVSAPE